MLGHGVQDAAARIELPYLRLYLFRRPLQEKLLEHLSRPILRWNGDAGAAREAVQQATLLALRALGVVDARARGLVAQVALP